LPTTVEQLEEIMRINGGEREGNNLFHSFEEFSIPEGMEAIFENATDIENIFTRITGDDISNIDGILSTQGDANFFLINSNGIIFGENAQLNVGGSFLASTAESIEFEDGSKFATNVNEPLLTISLPIGLGLGSNPGAITVNGSGNQIASDSAFSPIDLGNTESGLSVAPEKTLALIGGEISFSGGIVTAEGGKIELGSVKSGSVGFEQIDNQLAFNYDNIQSYQDINFSEQALLDTSGTGKGAISLTGNNVSLSDASFLLNQNRGNVDSGSININASDSLKLSETSENGEVSSSIRSQALNSGKTGKIEINTKQLFVLDKTRISTSTFGQAAGNELNINTTDSVKIVDSGINASTYAEGNAGNINLSTSDLQALDSGVISSSTFGTGNSGNVNVKAESIEIAEGSETERSNISATSFNSGNAGNLNIDTEQLMVRNGGSVSSSGLAEGDAGSVVVNASKLVEIEGVNQNFRGTNPESTIRSTVIATTPRAREAFGLPAIPTGNAGNVTVKTPSLKISAQGNISVENQGTGNAGTLSIDVKDINLDSSGSITAAAASGEGGNIEINTTNLIAKKNSQIITNARGQGNGGNIQIDVEVLAGLDNSDITANAIAGMGGNIDLSSAYIY
jgi:filamentous hemagglutinin family protein